MRIVDIIRQNSILSEGRIVDLLRTPSGVGTGTGQTIYRFIPKDEAIGVLESPMEIGGEVEDDNVVLGVVFPQIEVVGHIEEQEVIGELDNINEIKANESCP